MRNNDDLLINNIYTYIPYNLQFNDNKCWLICIYLLTKFICSFRVLKGRSKFIAQTYFSANPLDLFKVL
jgi:hypothetical protein